LNHEEAWVSMDGIAPCCYLKDMLQKQNIRSCQRNIYTSSARLADHYYCVVFADSHLQARPRTRRFLNRRESSFVSFAEFLLPLILCDREQLPTPQHSSCHPKPSLTELCSIVWCGRLCFYNVTNCGDCFSIVYDGEDSRGCVNNVYDMLKITGLMSR